MKKAARKKRAAGRRAEREADRRRREKIAEARDRLGPAPEPPPPKLRAEAQLRQDLQAAMKSQVAPGYHFTGGDGSGRLRLDEQLVTAGGRVLATVAEIPCLARTANLRTAEQERIYGQAVRPPS